MGTRCLFLYAYKEREQVKKFLIISLLLGNIVHAYDAYLPKEISYKKYDQILHMGANKVRMYHECIQRTNDEKYCYKTIKTLHKLDKEVYKVETDE